MSRRKTKGIIIGRKEDRIDIKLEGGEIEQVDSFKYRPRYRTYNLLKRSKWEYL